jgi:hypothetical protein
MSDKPASTLRSDAVISDCGTYRYALMRRWAQGYPLRFVMLNPSTADATLDDPTIRRCVGFAQREGFAAAIVLNLYAYRATDPKAILTCSDPVGPDNDKYLWNHLFSASEGPTPVVAAWGVNAHLGRVQQVLGLVQGVDWRCLGTTRDGHPRHPLYVRGDQPLVSFAKPDSRPSDRGSALVATFLLGVIVTALVGAFLLGEARRCESLREQDSALVERYCGEER